MVHDLQENLSNSSWYVSMLHSVQVSDNVVRYPGSHTHSLTRDAPFVIGAYIFDTTIVEMWFEALCACMCRDTRHFQKPRITHATLNCSPVKLVSTVCRTRERGTCKTILVGCALLTRHVTKYPIVRIHCVNCTHARPTNTQQHPRHTQPVWCAHCTRVAGG